MPLRTDDRLLEQHVSDCRHQQHHSVECGGHRGEMVFPHPPGGEWKQGKPEQQVQIGPEHCARHPGAGMEHVMMIVPVNTNIEKTHDVAEEHRQYRYQGFQAAALRYLHLQHHDRDDDRDHAVTERFQSPLAHLASCVPLVNCKPWLPSRRCARDEAGKSAVNSLCMFPFCSRSMRTRAKRHRAPILDDSTSPPTVAKRCVQKSGSPAVTNRALQLSLLASREDIVNFPAFNTLIARARFCTKLSALCLALFAGALLYGQFESSAISQRAVSDSAATFAARDTYTADFQQQSPYLGGIPTGKASATPLSLSL